MIVQGASMSECWLKVLMAVSSSKAGEISPLIANYSTTGIRPIYQDDLENDLNDHLNKIEKPEFETTASTIFPKSLAGGNHEVFERFDKIWKYIKKDKLNHKGHYFRRLVAFNEKNGKPINQLKHIIETYNGIDGIRKPVHRRSALIALTFDPTQDHTAQVMRGFPCLQQVCFLPKKNGKMALNAIYAMQHLVNRGYGNYLGLKNLGEFMARQMGLELEEVNCIASVIDMAGTDRAFTKKIISKYGKYV